MRTLQKELEEVRAQRSKEVQDMREDKTELDVLRAKCERLESSGGGGMSAVGLLPSIQTIILMCAP